MERVKWEDYNGKRIITSDIDNCSMEEFIQVLAESGALIRKEPLGSVLSLVTGGTGTPMFTDRVMFTDFLRLNTPHIKASVVAGLPKMYRSMLQVMVEPTGREMKMVDTKEEALEWLVGQ